ncbi:MAG: MFS transporter, partial [Ignavibacteriales bacterium]
MLTIQRDLTKAFYTILALPATAMGFALSIQISALSWILNSQYHLDIHEIGIVWAAGPLAGIFGQVIIGLISDKVWFWGGRRRPFILIGGTLAALMLIALPNFERINSSLGIGNLMAVAIVVALTLDLAINISFNPTRSIIADITPDGVPRTKGYTWMQTISGFWGVMAYAVGAIFGNYFLIYIGALIVLAFSLIPPFFIKENRDLTSTKIETETTEKKINVTQWGELFKLYFAHAFSWIGVQTMFVYIIAFIQQKLNPSDE